MDDKTERLRDIFIDVSEDETVTERQEESPGSLADDRGVEERLFDLVEHMRERYEFSNDLDDDDLIGIARGFYDDLDDEALAAAVDTSESEAFSARLDLHLVRASDHEGPLAADRLKKALKSGEIPDSEEIEASEENALERQLEAARAAVRMRQSSYRFRDEFDELLGDGDVADHMPDDVTLDGLAEATEDLEVDTGF